MASEMLIADPNSIPSPLMRKVTLESPEEFKTSLKTFAEAEDSSKLSAHKHKIRHDPLKKRPLVPSSHSQHSLSTHPTPKIANDQSTNRDNFRTDFEDGPKIDTNYIISGYQQRQGPTRKRALISSDQDFITFSTPLPQSTQLAYNKNEFPINNYNEFSTLPPLDFGHPYKANSLLGKLRQKYEAVQKEKVIPVSSKPSSPISKSLPSTNRLNNLFEFLFGSINTDTIKFIIYCILWYASSAVTNNIGKQILNHFRYPITLTWIQFGFVVIYCYGFANLLGLSHIKSPTKHILIETIPLSLFQILGHVFSSVATSHVPVSFVHTIKALSPLFTVLLYRFAFRVNYSSAVYISLMPLTIGVMLACSSHSTSNFIGFIFAMGSTLIFVVQNIFSKKLLFNQDHGSERKKLDKLNLLFYSSTFAFLFMTPMWIYYDGIYLFIEGFWPKHVHDPNTLSTNTKSGWTVAFYFFLNGTTHFVQNILAFSILAITSPVTYSIASLVKRIFVITASIIWFGQSTTMAQGVGICLTFGGLYMYNNAKRDVDKKEKKAREADEILLPLTRSENEVDFKKIFTKRSSDESLGAITNYHGFSSATTTFAGSNLCSNGSRVMSCKKLSEWRRSFVLNSENLQLKHTAKDMAQKSFSMAKNFAVVGAIFSGTECMIESYRAKNDLYNSMSAGCITGAVLAARAGPQATAMGCMGFAAFSTAVDYYMRRE